MKISSNLLVGLVLVLGIGMSHTESDGFPPESCTTMAPEYEVDAQEGPCPFEIVALENYTFIGGSIQVRIASKDPSSDLFEEFIVMAFNAADDNNYSPLGSFQIPAESSNDARMMNCPDEFTEDIGVTNSNGDPKESLEFVWTAPEDFVGTVIIKATFVKDTNTFWVKENTKFITVTPDPGVTTTSSTPSTRAPTSPTTTTTRGSRTSPESTTINNPTIATASTTQGTTSVASHLVRQPIIILITLIGFLNLFL